MIYRDLEKVRTIIDEATGLEVSYAYDDLVFPDHTAFIIQFDDTKASHFFGYFHKDCNPADQKRFGRPIRPLPASNKNANSRSKEVLNWNKKAKK